MPLDISIADYRQVFQELLVDGTSFDRNTGGVNVVLFRASDLQPAPQVESSAKEKAHADILNEFAAAIREFRTRSNSPLIVGLCPSASETSAIQESAFAERLREVTGVSVLDVNSAMAEVDPSGVFDSHADAIGNIPYQPAFFAELAFALARAIHSLGNRPTKLIAIDADETLWHGRVAEDGIDGIKLTEGHRSLQRFLHAQRKKGALLALCSKNVERDVVAVFERHPEWPLKLDDFATTRINWDEKFANLESLSEQFGFATDSFIFIDDDQIECSKIRAAHPEIVVLELPERAEDFGRFLEAVWLFDRSTVTTEDLHREAFYARDQQRATLRGASPTFEAFLESLQLEVRFQNVETEHLSRCAQLTQRTTQFNLNSIQRTEAELAAFAKTAGNIVETVSLRDRFGDYGIVGLLACQPGHDALKVTTFLLSCRALGRGIEHRMLQRILDYSGSLGLDTVEFNYLPTQRSLPLLLFLKAFAEEREKNCFTISSRQTIPFKTITNIAAPAQSPSQGQVTRPDWTYLGKAFSNRDSRHKAIAHELECGRRSESHQPFVPPSSPLEHTVAELWLTQIPIDRIGSQDNFFDLGGTSLQLVEIHRQLHQRGFTHITIADLFKFPTVATLATCLSASSFPQTPIARAKLRGSKQRSRLSAFRK